MPAEPRDDFLEFAAWVRDLAPSAATVEVEIFTMRKGRRRLWLIGPEVNEADVQRVQNAVGLRMLDYDVRRRDES